MTRNYWLTWAYKQGRNHYETRSAWDSKWTAAECVSGDPDEQAAARRGWEDAETASRTLDESARCQCYEVPTLAPTDNPREIVCERCAQ